MADCKACGHRDTQHSKFGCNQGFCKCELSNQDVIDFEKLSALSEAGEKMADAAREIIDILNGDVNESISFTSQPIAAALTEWEAANK